MEQFQGPDQTRAKAAAADTNVSAGVTVAQRLALERDTVPGVANAALDYAADQRTAQRARLPTLDQLARAFDQRLWAVFSSYALVVPQYRSGSTSEADITTTSLRIYEVSSQALGTRIIARKPNDVMRLLTPRDAYLLQRPLATLYPLTDGHAAAFASHAEYVQTLDAALEAYGKGLRPDMTLEEYNMLQLRSLAAHDLELLHAKDVDIVSAAAMDDIVHAFQASERALRILNAINRMRPDARPPRALLDARESYGWLTVTSDELLSTYMIDEPLRVHDATGVRADTRVRVAVSKNSPATILGDVAQRYGQTLDDMFPPVPLGMPSIRTAGAERNRLISLGLLPIVLASMDDRMRVLNPPVVVATYMYNLVRNVLDTHLNTSPHHVVALQQLEHNLDWMRQLDALSASALVPTAHLYTVAHQNITCLVHARQQLTITACRKIIESKSPQAWTAIEAGVQTAMRELGLLPASQTLAQNAHEQILTAELGTVPDATRAAFKRRPDAPPDDEPAAKRTTPDAIQ